MHKEDKPLIYVCSPYGGHKENYKAALVYAGYVFNSGAIPVIPHTMYHGILNDNSECERKLGMEAGKRLLKLCQAVWVFGKQGEETTGMCGEISLAESVGIPVVYIACDKPFKPNARAAALSEVLKKFKAVFGEPNRIIVEDIKKYITDGFPSDLICAVIDETARHEKRWAYALSILRRLQREGITTEEAFLQSIGKKKTDSGGYAGYDLAAFEKMLDEN